MGDTGGHKNCFSLKIYLECYINPSYNNIARKSHILQKSVGQQQFLSTRYCTPIRTGKNTVTLR